MEAGHFVYAAVSQFGMASSSTDIRGSSSSQRQMPQWGDVPQVEVDYRKYLESDTDGEGAESGQEPNRGK